MNKKYLFLALILFSCIPFSFAQKFEKKLALGVSGGVTLSKVSFLPTVQQGMRTGRTGGLTVRWISEKNLGLQAEINYLQAGWKEEFDDPKYNYDRCINYIEVPFLTHIYFGNKNLRFIFNLGPKFGFFMNENTSENLNGETPNKTNEQHNMPTEEKLDWGLCGGPGLEWSTNIGSFILESRYAYSLGNIYKDRKEDFFSKSSSQIISIKLSYLFTLKSK